jgi:phenylpropionate dioxygenase-like ring-hydroxylating dioxygenase large terminal subunit
MLTHSVRELLDMSEGLISRKIFLSEEVYRLELERVFAKCWLFLGHESQIGEPGDYITNYMGEDPVIVGRDSQGRIHAFLNSCRHRGMKVCRTDFGNAAFFRCSYHGWTYSNAGKLIGVPFHKEAYYGELRPEQWGLLEVPRVKSYGGLIFGCWDEGAISLDEYLGDVRWYLDIFLERPLGGLEVIPGRQTYVIAANWKIPADNAGGDNYHVPYSHGSLAQLGLPRHNPVGYQSAATVPVYTVAFDHGHALAGGVATEGQRYRADLSLAEPMGPEVVEYVKQCQRRLEDRLTPNQAAVYALPTGNIFPNFTFTNFSALRPIGLYLWHPKGAQKMEPWQWCAVDRKAPQSVKDLVRIEFSRGQSPAGLVGQDDTENFEQVTEATRGVMGQQLDFNYQMGCGHEGDIEVAGCPGRFGPYYSEHCQRNFYGYWAKLMNR